ncbi:glutathione S-transferase family protein [Mariprofundus ferrooxydans]|uniref:Putative glutathione S-transferase n=1 Tax=Mariprofundus ferrooxydans PV-1 TaxID=314345 RepID=Q0EZY2_9PROT|nr:glutathione S-transferase family protein [Mariprofundus ferrooxydans]EAU54902.1 putative glutathione S-transferase [Mariprofundus ferrooxydans PV-1]KON46790.1 glutathionyl-hydroquinone reductase YqjG [Mariprofundus ferrooxydans]
MGLLIDGKWSDQWYDTSSTGGRFVRSESQFHCQSDHAHFSAEADRYRLYVSLACPWAHRTLIMRRIKGLESIIPVTVVHPHMLEQGWQFDEPEPLYGFTCLHELYCKADPHYSGRVTVPVLWDSKQESIVCNESAEIIRIFNRAFDALTGNSDDYYPLELRDQIDAINAFVYDNINNGVYRCGFATTQQAYDEAFDALFAALDVVEARLGQQRYLVGNHITEADIRLFPTLIRFDAVYVGHFKCNRNRIAEMPNLSNYLRDLYQWQDIAGTVNFEHIKQHYYYSHASINPTRIVPKGPAQDFEAPHDRKRFSR